MTQFSGICLSCKNASNCNFPRSSAKPIIQCEEFEGFPNRKTETSVKNTMKSPNPTNQKRSEGKTLEQELGLCRNCENRATCKFPRQEGGTWHCEEYR